ncbi:MAG: DUF1667 domain-containing protein [Eubacteriales bacterium]|nr:DUF1667 domain-containing protein [Eubacteriales bacterium]
MPKAKIFDCMREIESKELQPPVYMGDVVYADVCGTGVDVIATKTVE